MNYDVFISYSRIDTPVADKLCNAFDAAGISYFIDRQGIGGGMEFPEVLAKAIKESRLFLLLGSKNSYNSKFTNSEIFYAFNKKERNSIIPYLIDDAPMPDSLEFAFAAINWRNIKTHPTEKLVADLLSLLGRESASKESEDIEVEAWVKEADKLMKDRKFLEAMPLIQKAVSKNNAHAKALLGYLYNTGNGGVKRDMVIAEKWYTEAAEQGDAEAMFRLGQVYRWGYGGVIDYEKAFNWFSKSASLKNGEAMYSLAGMYSSGEAVQKDINKYIDLLKESFEYGYTEAAYSLGIYYDGKDDEESLRWLKKASDKGHYGAYKMIENIKSRS